jgi:hypothetical protein
MRIFCPCGSGNVGFKATCGEGNSLWKCTDCGDAFVIDIVRCAHCKMETVYDGIDDDDVSSLTKCEHCDEKLHGAIITVDVKYLWVFGEYVQYAKINVH